MLNVVQRTLPKKNQEESENDLKLNSPNKKQINLLHAKGKSEL